MIAVIDYGRGNLFSIGQAFRKLGASHVFVSDPANLDRAERIVLPGVGAFGDAMKTLTERGFTAPIRKAAAAGVPVLGICLGMQLLTDESEEFGRHQGLGLIPGKVKRLPDGNEVRIPNVGWRVLRPRHASRPPGDWNKETMCYFVHSFAPMVADEADVAATIAVNGRDIAAIIRRGNTVGYQFHPEKSGAAGLRLIQGFLDL